MGDRFKPESVIGMGQNMQLQPNTASYRIGAGFSCTDRQYPNIDNHWAPLH